MIEKIDEGYIHRENLDTIREAKELAGDFYPTCRCFQSEETTAEVMSEFSPLAQELVGQIRMSGACGPAVPFAMLQIFAMAIAHSVRDETLAAAHFNPAPKTPEETTRDYEDAIALRTANIAHLLPKVVAAHAVRGRRVASTLGAPIAAVRTS